MRDQLEIVEQLMVGFARQRQIIRAVQERHPRATFKRVLELMGRIRQRWAVEDTDRKAQRRQEQVQNIERTIARLDARIADVEAGAAVVEVDKRTGLERRVFKHVPPGLGGLYANKERYLALLAKLTGTEQAQEVNVNVGVTIKATLVEVLGNLTGDEVSEALAAAEENERLANAYREQAIVVHSNGKAHS